MRRRVRPKAGTDLWELGAGGRRSSRAGAGAGRRGRGDPERRGRRMAPSAAAAAPGEGAAARAAAKKKPRRGRAAFQPGDGPSGGSHTAAAAAPARRFCSELKSRGRAAIVCLGSPPPAPPLPANEQLQLLHPSDAPRHLDPTDRLSQVSLRPRHPPRSALPPPPPPPKAAPPNCPARRQARRPPLRR